ncbi:MAG: BrnA antitoxin family protein [Gammaproteobacteria bacterium]
MKEKKKVTIKSDMKRIRNMTDADIDYSDIPELDDSFFDAPTVDWMFRRKESVTLRLDNDVLEWFRQGGKRGYQTRINAVLKAYMQAQKNRGGK